MVLVEKNQDHLPLKLLVNGRSSWDGEEHLSAGRNQPVHVHVPLPFRPGTHSQFGSPRGRS